MGYIALLRSAVIGVDAGLAEKRLWMRKAWEDLLSLMVQGGTGNGAWKPGWIACHRNSQGCVLFSADIRGRATGNPGIQDNRKSISRRA
jgi:hypothetical protein